MWESTPGLIHYYLHGITFSTHQSLLQEVNKAIKLIPTKNGAYRPDVIEVRMEQSTVLTVCLIIMTICTRGKI